MKKISAKKGKQQAEPAPDKLNSPHDSENINQRRVTKSYPTTRRPGRAGPPDN
jgi:hypothetical protein